MEIQNGIKVSLYGISLYIVFLAPKFSLSSYSSEMVSKLQVNDTIFFFGFCCSKTSVPLPIILLQKKKMSNNSSFLLTLV